ncbi:MAG: hypothetical protein CVV39_06155 [Planctomycetes bacterium HGW-Planctomycetes-1]|nr:MAG: hypothetical protein CVV39_06155 [Planctomycetes bacterium HGW-Planctomycetes-1]
MGSKKENIIECFIDKAILAVAGIAAIVILFMYVVGNPNATGYAGRKYGPKEIDITINKNAQRLQEQLDSEPNTANQYKMQKPHYLSLRANPFQQVIETEIKFPLPGYPYVAASAGERVYRIPSLPMIDKPAVAVVRMAAFVPTEELSISTPYESARTKLEDMDIVTIESAIDVKSLYDSFREAFAGRSLHKEWRMEQYAKPVFAKVELQKRIQQPDGDWSDWIEVPRTNICHIKKNLQLPQEASEYGIEIALVQFARPEFCNEILQPPVYRNAIPAEAWISPSFYNEREKILAKQREEARRLEIEAERAKRLMERSQPGRTPATTRPSVRGGPEVADEAGTSRTVPGPAVRTPASTRRPTRDTTPAADSQMRQLSEDAKFEAVKLTAETDIADMKRLVFWAHDDTTKPGEKYQYRIRIGLLNPIAGRGWVGQDQQSLNDQIVLWSDFTELGEVIEIPRRLVFFATNIREVKKSTGVDRTVEVMAAKYILGNWASWSFSVKNGEEIGQVVETIGDSRLNQMGIVSDTIDFSTGAVMVDVQKVTEWIGTGFLRPREYAELLYSRDGKTIEKVAIRERFWPAEVVKTYKEISEALAAPPITLLNWSQAASWSGGRQ